MGKWFWVILAAVVVVMVGGVLIFGGQVDAPQTRVDNPHELTDEDFTQGSADARVTVIKYSDFQCPACAASATILKDIKEEFDDDVRFVYRFFHVTQPALTTRNAALASVAASQQNKFWEMHDLLFERQQEWAQNPQAQSLFEGYATELGLDIDRFKEDLGEAGDRVDRDISISQQLGLQSTPTFFINGEPLEQNPGSAEAWRSVLREAIAQTDNTE